MLITLHVKDTNLTSRDRETLQAHGANLTSSKPSRIGKGEDKDDITADGTEDGIGNQTYINPEE